VLPDIWCSAYLYVNPRTLEKDPTSISVDRRCWDRGRVENNVRMEKTSLWHPNPTEFFLAMLYQFSLFDPPVVIMPISIV
jgi:hypothetical protein